MPNTGYFELLSQENLINKCMDVWPLRASVYTYSIMSHQHTNLQHKLEILYRIRTEHLKYIYIYIKKHNPNTTVTDQNKQTKIAKIKHASCWMDVTNACVTCVKLGLCVCVRETRRRNWRHQKGVEIGGGRRAEAEEWAGERREGRGSVVGPWHEWTMFGNGGSALPVCSFLLLHLAVLPVTNNWPVKVT